MKKQFFQTVLLFGAMILFYGCDFGDMNIDKYNPPYNAGGGEITVEIDPTSKYADIDINYRLADGYLQNYPESSIGPIFANLTYEGCYNDYQRTTNLTHDIYCAYVANNKPGFNYSSPSYTYTDGWSGLRWKFFYTARTVGEYSQLLRTFYFNNYAKYKNAFYITRIYWAFLASMNTDTYGDMPMADYVRGRIPSNPDSVKYDKQSNVYDMIFRLLEQATDSIVPGMCAFKFDKQDDRCFRGDEEQWLRFANTLRLRLALRISNVDPSRAKLEGEAAMSNKWGLMRGNFDRMRTVPRYAPVDQGGENEGGQENVLAMCSFAYNGDCVLSKDLELAYKEQSVSGATYNVGFRPAVEQKIDPRCLVCWWRPAQMVLLKEGREPLQNPDFCGCEIGDFNVDHTTTVEKYSITRTDLPNSKNLDPKHYFSYSRETVWLGYPELQFLLAEASLRGWAGASKSPKEYFEDGIRASMNYYEISGSDAEAYVSGLKIYQGGGVENPFETGNKELMLEHIITQKWLAVFPNGNEGWAEFRRTDYPRLRNSLNNTSGGDVPDGKFIKRILYPYGAKNNVFKPTADDSQGKRLWWDVADTNDNAGNRVTPNNFR